MIRYLAKRVYVLSDAELVESGDTLDVFERPQHSYTQALIASIPGRIARAAVAETSAGERALSDRKGLARI